MTGADGGAEPDGTGGAGGPDGAAASLDEAAGTSPGDAAGKANGPAGAAVSRRGRKHRSFSVELPVLVVVALVIALLIKSFMLQPFYIPSSSMENTLLVGDKVLVNKLVYHFRKIEPGDIVVFNGAGSWVPALPKAKPSSDPAVRLYDATLRPLFSSIAGLFGTAPGQTDFIKRVIGVPGDHVMCCNAQGLVTVNGVPLHETSYLYPGDSAGSVPAGYPGRFSITVPPGRLWVMGDHRSVSDDSRLRPTAPGHGTIPENEVIGRAFVIVWPPSQWRVLPIPSTFSQPGVSSSSSPAAKPSAKASTASRAGALTAGVPVAASGPWLPLAAGFAGVAPVPWLRRRIRRRRHA